jgi:CO/xanthine dehydrogenase FAD-binding subunit
MRVQRPRDLDGVRRGLVDDPGATLLGGGTDLMVEVNLAHRRPASVLALRRVGELGVWEDRFIGAGVTYARAVTGPLPALAELARTVGSPQIRAVGTIGGNLGTASPAGDVLPFLAAMDAHVVLASDEGTRRLRWDEFLLGPKRTALRPGEVILGVSLPDRLPERQAFAKVGVRQAMAIALVNCCVVREEDGTTRVALGAVGPTVLRARAAEAFLTELSRPSPSALDEFQRLVTAEVSPISDHRASAAYRRHAAGVLARRTLERCLP